jgi:O-acetyl-ADP-ribose deacetylase (regulator of RNase III)
MESTALDRIELVKGDIVREDVDAIVNAANEGLWAGGGVCGAIHDAAGPELQAECRAVGRCPTGSARITKGYRLRARHVIHAVGPRYGGLPEDPGRLASAYRESMRLAARNGVETLAFPSISTGIFGYPLEEAAAIALATVAEELTGDASSVTSVRFVLWDDRTHEVYRAALNKLRTNRAGRG